MQFKTPTTTKIKKTTKKKQQKNINLKSPTTTKKTIKLKQKTKRTRNTSLNDRQSPTHIHSNLEDDLISKNIYLNNKELLLEVKKAKAKRRMTNKLAQMLQLLCAKYAKKGNFVNYSYNDDMQAYAMMMLVRTWDSFDPEKSDNPFAFFTQCIKNSFIQYLNQEKRQRNIRDLLLVNNGMNPSFAFSEEEFNDELKQQNDEEENFNYSTHDLLLKQIKNIHVEDFNEEFLAKDNSQKIVT